MAPKLPAGVDPVEIAKRLLAHIDAKSTDEAPGTLAVDPREYTDPDIARREREMIFAKVPIVAAHGSELAVPGSYISVQLPNNEVLVVRQPDGSLKAFVNVCRHRGARLVEDDAGKRKVFICRYHGWSYSQDGSLRGITHPNTFGEVDTSCFGLVALPVEERHGFVWVVDSPGASIDVAGWLGEQMDESLGSLGLADYLCYRVGTFDEPINWKAQVDGQIDTYHINFLHAKTVAQYFQNNVQLWEPLGRHGRKFSARKKLEKYRDEILDGSRSPDRYMTLSHLVLPTTQILRQPDHFQLLTILPDPHDVNRSRMQIRLLVEPEAVSNPDSVALWDKNWQILMDVIRDEDIAVNRELQQALRNTDVPPLIMGRNEVGNQVFHRWVTRALDGDLG